MSHQSNQTDAGQTLHALIASEWEWRSGELGPQVVGDPTHVTDFLPRVGVEHQHARTQRWEHTLAALQDISRADLSAEDQVHYDVCRNQIQTLVESQHVRAWERPINADSAFWRNLNFGAARQRLIDEPSAQAYLRRLSSIPQHFAEQIENMRSGVRRGVGPARVTMSGREEPVRALAQAEDVTEVALFAPLNTLPKTMAQSTREALYEQGVQVMRTQVQPAYAQLLEFLQTEYLPHLPQEIAAHEQPDGVEFYAASVRQYTTTELSPTEIHELGLKHVRLIRQEMEDVAEQVGFGGDLDGLFAHMRSDPQFYATTERQLQAEAAYTCKAFDRVVHQYFGRLPNQRFGVIPTPADIAPFDTFGRGAPDAYFLNTYNLSARPLYSLPSLTLHESAPGHSFQLSLARELDLPEFRRLYLSAFGEGWGLYCERLGQEMGMYETPYEVMGMLSFQMWRAVRLVVDPGMHALGWSREQAQDFLRENTAIAEHEIVTEIDRYIAWPGQATAYFVGQLRIEANREKAEAALGAHFDIREFHDTVLGLGSVPLTVLDSQIDAYIAAKRETIG